MEYVPIPIKKQRETKKSDEEISAKACIKQANTPIPNTPIIKPFKYIFAWYNDNNKSLAR